MWDVRPNDASLAAARAGASSSGECSMHSLSSYEELQAQVNEIKLTMTDNVEVMLQNSEKARVVEGEGWKEV